MPSAASSPRAAPASRPCARIARRSPTCSAPSAGSAERRARGYALVRGGRMSEATPHEIEELLLQLNEEFVGWKDPPRRLAQILERNELALYAQPMLSLKDRVPFPMAEVLVRLRGDDEILLPPNGFLPLFAHFGLLPKLDRWV